MEPMLVGLSSIFLSLGSILLSLLLKPKRVSDDYTKYKSFDPFYSLQHPHTEELREIYREIDLEAGIRDPDLLTPEKGSETKYWANLLYIKAGETLIREVDWMPRQEIAVVVSGDSTDTDFYDIVETLEFPKWDRNPAWVSVGVFKSPDKGTPWIAHVMEGKTLQKGDRIVLNKVKPDAPIMQLGTFPPAGEPRIGLGLPDGYTVNERKFETPQVALAEMRRLQLEKEMMMRDLKDQITKYVKDIQQH